MFAVFLIVEILNEMGPLWVFALCAAALTVTLIVRSR